MKRSWKYILFATLLFLPMTRTDVYACDCAGNRPPCEAYWEASAVFAGIVTNSSMIVVKDGDQQYQQRLVNFAVEADVGTLIVNWRVEAS